jgi:hypothetical protein
VGEPAPEPTPGRLTDGAAGGASDGEPADGEPAGGQPAGGQPAGAGAGPAVRGRRVVGAIGGPALVVDRGGGLRLPGGGRFEWWIGADDRWRFPSREVASRQRLVDGLPVAETAVRVPGGDAIERVWVVAGPVPAAVVEIENASPAPFAVAFVTDGPVALGLARPVGAAAQGASLDDLRRTVTTGGAVLTGPPGEAVAARPEAAARDDHTPGAEARLVPVAHRTTVRVAVALGGAGPAPDPASLPGADVVLRGWRAVLDRAARVVVADEAVQEAVVTARARLLLPLDDDERRAPARLAALAAWGFAQEVVALGARPTLGDLPASGSWADLGSPDDPAFLGRLRALLVADDAGAGAGASASAADLAGAGDGVGGGAGDGLRLLPGFPPEWAGQPVEVHDLPTTVGHLSFALRWHGERPALLWDVVPSPGAPTVIGSGHPDQDPPPGADPPSPGEHPPAIGPVAPPADLVLRAPALDPAWVGHGPSGEALLAPMPPPGDPAPDRPDAGDDPDVASV